MSKELSTMLKSLDDKLNLIDEDGKTKAAKIEEKRIYSPGSSYCGNIVYDWCRVVGSWSEQPYSWDKRCLRC